MVWTDNTAMLDSSFIKFSPTRKLKSCRRRRWGHPDLRNGDGADEDELPRSFWLSFGFAFQWPGSPSAIFVWIFLGAIFKCLSFNRFLFFFSLFFMTLQATVSQSHNSRHSSSRSLPRASTLEMQSLQYYTGSQK